MAHMKEQIKTPEKNLIDKEIANLSDAEFITLVTRMLTEIIDYSLKIKEEVKVIKSEIKKNIQGNNSEGKEAETHINIRKEQTEEINIQLEQNEETKFKKMRRGLGTSGTTLKIPISES